MGKLTPEWKLTPPPRPHMYGGAHPGWAAASGTGQRSAAGSGRRRSVSRANCSASQPYHCLLGKMERLAPGGQFSASAFSLLEKKENLPHECAAVCELVEAAFSWLNPA